MAYLTASSSCGRRRALWISKSDALIEDARRDWSALGQERLLVQPLSRFRPGTPIRLHEGILFLTYATLRSAERDGKPDEVSKNARTTFQADGKLKWESVIQVLDVCQQAGFKNISFVPPPDFGVSGQ